jgi:hypothetical protein
MPEAGVTCTACLECSVEFLLSGGNLIQESLAPKTRVFLFICAFFFLDFMRRKLVMFLGNWCWEYALEVIIEMMIL